MASAFDISRSSPPILLSVHSSFCHSRNHSCQGHQCPYLAKSNGHFLVVILPDPPVHLSGSVPPSLVSTFFTQLPGHQLTWLPISFRLFLLSLFRWVFLVFPTREAQRRTQGLSPVVTHPARGFQGDFYADFQGYVSSEPPVRRVCWAANRRLLQN